MAGLLTVDDLLALPVVPPDVSLAYGPHAEQFGHLYMPAGAGPHPVVVLLHGGCWRARVNLTYMGGFARALTEDGVAVWNLEYRRLDLDGGWPNTFLDVAKGADYLKDGGGQIRARFGSSPHRRPLRRRAPGAVARGAS